MYEDFYATNRGTGQSVHCLYQALILAISTRHADAVDIKFLADGKPVWLALPHPAWVEYNRRTGKVITDPMAVQIAGHYLKWAIEADESGGREMYALSVADVLQHLEQLVEEERAGKLPPSGQSLTRPGQQPWQPQ
jgi:hypothetical protein